jgi:hypothetical protein
MTACSMLLAVAGSDMTKGTLTRPKQGQFPNPRLSWEWLKSIQFMLRLVWGFKGPRQGSILMASCLQSRESSELYSQPS